MNSRFLAGVAAATLAAFVGSDSLIDGAQSLTIPSLCVDGEACAALCRAHVEDGRTPEDFIQQAAYELGPQASTIQPAARQSEHAAADRPEERLRLDRDERHQPGDRRRAEPRLCSELDHWQGRRHRSRNLPGGRQLFRHPQPAAHRAVVGSADAVGGGRHQLSRRPRLGGGDRPQDRQGHQDDRPARRLQHVFHPRRALGDRRRRGQAAARVPRPAHNGAAGLHRRAALRRNQPRRLRARRVLRDLHLRIRRHAGQDRSRPPHARRHAAAFARPHPAGHPHRAPTARRSSSPTCSRTG